MTRTRGSVSGRCAALVVGSLLISTFGVPLTSAQAHYGAVWPFTTKSTSQYQRVDQGWDLQAAAGAQILAIAPGVLHQANKNPGAFGNDYPYETLDSAMTVNRGGGAKTRTFSSVYYGHVHVVASLVGKHVIAGQVIATANKTDCSTNDTACNGSLAPAGWLEVGFGANSPVDPGTAPTDAGYDMQYVLVDAPPPATNHAPIGSLDSAVPAPTEIEVGGWAYDSDTTAAINVDVYVDGTNRARTLADLYRPDVPYGAYHGYDVGIGGIAAGPHTVCTYGIDSAGGTNPQLGGCKSVTVLSGNPFGSFDTATVGAGHTVALRGWAIDPDTTAAINVDIWYDSMTKYGGRFVANATRTDVGAVYPGYGSGHGYAVTLTLPAGTHTLCAFGINFGAGTTNPQLAPAKPSPPSRATTSRGSRGSSVPRR